MSRRSLNAVIRYLQKLSHAQQGNGASDAELLERYVRCRDEAAFELLVWRHGALVFNVCRRILPCEQDAEDAFQATFLAFVRKAGSISRRGSVAPWLHKVAYRVALAAKARRVKIATREKPCNEVLAAAVVSESNWTEIRPILDEEVNRLPERLRRPFVLCYLEGKTNEEAARQLGCPAGTIFSRLARGREMLRRRLQRRGVTLSVATLTAALTAHAAEAMPAAMLMTTTVQSAFLFVAGKTVSGASIEATTLAEGVLKTMFITKLKVTAVMVLLAGLFALSGVFARQAPNAAPQPEDEKEKPVVSVVHPTPGGLPRTSRYAGHVRPVAQQQVYPVVSGYVKRLAVDLGDKVKKGDILAEIEAPLLEMEVQQARAALTLEQRQVEAARADVTTAMAEVKLTSDRTRLLEAKLKSDEASVVHSRKEFEHSREMYKKGLMDERGVDRKEDQVRMALQEVDATRQAIQNVRWEIALKESKVQSAKVALEIAKSKIEIARLAVQKAELQLNFAMLRANFDGVVVARNANTGEFVSSGEQGGRRSMLTVMPTDSLRAVIDVADGDVPFVHPGTSIRLQSAALPENQMIDCKVSRISYVVDENAGTMSVEVDVPNLKNLLRPGMFISAYVEIDKKALTNTVTVPVSSIVKLKGQIFVYIVRDDKAHLTPVRGGGYKSDDKMEIESGLRPSDSIVVDPRGLEGEVVSVRVKKAP